jgi:hypothetical protein
MVPGAAFVVPDLERAAILLVVGMLRLFVMCLAASRWAWSSHIWCFVLALMWLFRHTINSDVDRRSRQGASTQLKTITAPQINGRKEEEVQG